MQFWIGDINYFVIETMHINFVFFCYYFSKDNILDKFAAQSKLLIDLSEQIWDCLNLRKYLIATQLFQFASCIKTSMFININIMT